MTCFSLQDLFIPPPCIDLELTTSLYPGDSGYFSTPFTLYATLTSDSVNIQDITFQVFGESVSPITSTLNPNIPVEDDVVADAILTFTELITEVSFSNFIINEPLGIFTNYNSITALGIVTKTDGTKCSVINYTSCTILSSIPLFTAEIFSTDATYITDHVLDITGKSGSLTINVSSSLITPTTSLAEFITAPNNLPYLIQAQSNNIYFPQSKNIYQIGSTLTGEANEDQSGFSVSTNGTGNIVAIGAILNDPPSLSNAGHVKVYKNIRGNWQQIGQDIDGDRNSGQAGYSISINYTGNIIAIGAFRGGSVGGGSVKIYQYNDVTNTWELLGSSIEGSTSANRLGSSVCLNKSGNILALSDIENDDGRGVVRIYTWNGFTWIQLGADIEGTNVDDFLGRSVSLNSDGDVIAIGISHAEANNRGSAKIYRYLNNANTWELIGSEILGDNFSSRFFGWSVSLNDSGSTVIIGAPSNSGVPGYTKVYTLTDNDWVQTGSTLSRQQNGDSFGYSVSINKQGNIIAIGAPTAPAFFAGKGRVAIYELINSNWRLIQEEIAPPPSPYSTFTRFGQSVNLNADGDRVVIGDNSFDVTNSTANNIGAAFLYAIEHTYPTPASIDVTASSFGITYYNITGFPCISAPGDILQSDALGFSKKQTTSYKTINRAIELFTDIEIAPQFASYSTLTGYSPYLSLYPNNTGTPFLITPLITGFNYADTPALSTVRTSYIDYDISSGTTLSTLTSYASSVNGFSIFNSQNTTTGPNGKTYPFSVFATISSPYYPFYSTKSSTKVITFVDPPTVTLEISSVKSFQQNNDLVIERETNFIVNVDGNLPCAFFFRTGIPELSSGVLTTETSLICSFDLSFQSTVPGRTYISSVTAYPLLSSIDPATNANYITGDLRTRDTGIQPIVIDKSYILTLYDAVIPEENIFVDYSLTPVNYGSKTSLFKEFIAPKQVQSTRYVNQFDQSTTSTLTLSAYINNSENIPLTKLFNTINKKNIYITVDFNNINKTSIYSLVTETGRTVVTTQSPITGEIIITTRPEDSLNFTTIKIPYSQLKQDYITPTLYFDQFVPAWYASILNPNPLKVIVWDDNIQSIDKVNAYAQGSKSFPYSESTTRYDTLIPQWSFEDVTGKKQETFSIQKTKIYSNLDNAYIGTSGFVDLYFKDDTPTGPQGELLVITPVVTGLIASKDQPEHLTDLPSYANPAQRTTLIYHVNNIRPTALNITRDGARDLKKYYWYTSSIPNTITIGTTQLFNEKYAIDFTYPYVNDTHPFYIGIETADATEVVKSPETQASNFSIEYYDTSFNATDKDGVITTGYARTNITPTISSANCRLIASTTVSPSNQYSHTPYSIFCDNKNNKICRMYFEKKYNNYLYTQCARNYIQQQYITTLIPETTGMYVDEQGSVDFMSLTGMTDATYIALDGLYNAWVTDAGRDVVYKIDPYGLIKTTINLPPGSSPATLCIDNKQNVWISLVDDISAVKYSPTGEYLTSIAIPQTYNYNENPKYIPGGIDTDIYGNVWVSFYNSVCSVIHKYTADGNFIFSLPLPPYHNTIDIFADGDNPENAYIVTENNAESQDYHTGSLLLATPNAITPLLSGFNTPQYVNLDIEKNIWMVLGNNYVLKHRLNESVNPREPITSLYDLSFILTDYTNNTSPIFTSSRTPNFDNPVTIAASNGDTWNFSAQSELSKYILGGSTSSLYASQDSGQSWVNIFPNESINWKHGNISKTGKYQAASGQFNVIAISEDYGITWNLTTFQNYWFKAFNASSSGKVIIAIIASAEFDPANKLLISTDYGNTWNVKETIPLSSSNKCSISISQNGEYITLVFKDSTSYIYTSNNFGNTWSVRGKQSIYTTCDMSDTGQYQAIGSINTSLSGVYLSKDFGVTWYNNFPYLAPEIIKMSRSGQYSTLFTTSNEIYTSKSFGGNWFKEHQLPSTYPDLNISIDNYGLTHIITYSDNFIINPWVINPIDLTTINKNINEQLTYRITGIGGLSDNTLVILDSEKNRALYCGYQDTKLVVKNIFTAVPLTTTKAGYNDKLNIGTWSSTGKTVAENEYFYEVLNSEWIPGIRAAGDWTGIRRSLKYCPPTATISYSISGASEEFEIKTSPPEIRIQNDSYDLADKLTNMFPEFLNSDTVPVLHKEFFPGVFGTSNSDYQTIGRQFFEKIANFCKNHSDIDFCNVNQLYSIADSVGIKIDDYNFIYPADIQRVLDIGSIPYKRLFGTLDKFNQNYKPTEFSTYQDNIQTITEKLNFNPDYPLDAYTQVYSGSTIVVHDEVLNKYDLLYIHTATIVGQLSGYGLRYPVYNFDTDTFNQYNFYNYKENTLPVIINSHIDWNSEQTTLTPSQTSIQEWFKDDGTLEQIFNYYLTKGLGFIE